MIVMGLQIRNTFIYFLEDSRRSYCSIKTNGGVCACFAILRYVDQFIVKKKNHESTTRVSAE